MPVSLGLRALMDSKDKLDFQEQGGCQVKRDLRERRASQGSVPAPLGGIPSSLACRVPQGFPDHLALLECLGYRDCLETPVCLDSLGSPLNWGPYQSNSTSLRASAGTVSRGRQPTQWGSWKKERRETRVSPACQAWTAVPGASRSGSAQELRRPGETTVRGIQAVLEAPACPVLRDCPAREEKRVRLA